MMVGEVRDMETAQKMVDEAVKRSGKNIPVRTTVVGIKGHIIRSG
jgi:hypothetical protein